MSEQKLKSKLSTFMLLSILLAFTFILYGGVLYLLKEGQNPLPYQHFLPPVTGSFSFKALSPILLGFLILVLAQILRVLWLGLYFFHQKEYLLALASFFIFILLAYGLKF